MDAIIQTRIDAKQKLAAQELFKSMGTSLGEAIRMFVSQSLREGAMPFKPTVDYTVNAKTQKELLKSLHDYKKGKEKFVVCKSMDEFSEFLDKAYGA